MPKIEAENIFLNTNILKNCSLKQHHIFHLSPVLHLCIKVIDFDQY